MGEFDNKVAVVTGGATGIGYATARRLASAGASVVICGRRGELVAARAHEAREQSLDIGGIAADVTSAADMARLMAHAVETHGGLDILICNAGVPSFGDVVTTEEADWDKTLAIHLNGTFLASKYAVPEMRKRGGGAIVTLGSIHSFATAYGRIAYSTAKSGILGLTRALALDHAADNIRANAVCPAGIDTPLLRDAWPRLSPGRPVDEVMEELAQLHPLHRVGAPEEVAEMIAYLAGPRSGFVTGAEFKIDGGVLARISIAPRP